MTGSSTMYVTPVTPDGVFVRSGQGAQYNAITSAFPGDALEVLDSPTDARSRIGVSGQWIKIKTAKGETGWVSGRYVQEAEIRPVVEVSGSVQPPAPGPSPSAGTQPSGAIKPLLVKVTYQQGIYLRSGAAKTFPQVAEAAYQEQLHALGEPGVIRAKLGQQNQWVEVKTAQGVQGWAAAWLLEEVRTFYKWPLGHALVGLHGPADPWPDFWNEGAYKQVRDGRIKAVKILSSGELISQGTGVVKNILDRLGMEGVHFVMARLFAKFEQPKTAKQFVDEVFPATKALYDLGVRYFEVHNEPNIKIPEGMWIAWQNGEEFGRFVVETIGLLRPQLKDALFGWPGVSPGFDIPDLRMNSDRFLADADFAIQQCDFVCMHVYWGDDGSSYQDALAKVQAFCNRYPDKAIFATEFSNEAKQVSKNVKGQEYAKFYTEAQRLPSNYGGGFSYILSAAPPDLTQDNWIDSDIGGLVGARAG